MFLELEGVLWFGSAPTLEKALLASLERATGIERVVLDLQGLGRVDVTGALVPGQLRENAEGAGLEVEFLNLPPHSEQVLGEVLGGRAS